MTSRYDEVYASWARDPEAFWAEAAGEIDWIKPWTQVLDDSNSPSTQWFVGAEVNTCFNALDRHADGGRGDQAALIYDSPVTGSKLTLTFNELRDRVASFAGALARDGATKGDRAIIYIPMVPEAVISMLACARLGVIHSVVFGGFAARELAIRIDDSTPKFLIAASCGIEPTRIVSYQALYDEALDIASHQPDKVIVLQREQEIASLKAGRDISWVDFVDGASPHACVPVLATDPLYILYTSGTTGIPKGVVRDNGGHMVALKWTMENIYGLEPGEVFWAASDIGWVVGHSYIVYAPLLHGCTTILYEGKPVGTLDAGAFWRVIAEHKVAALFTAPTGFRAIKRDDPAGELIKGHDLSHFRTLFLAGERADPDTIQWAEKHLKRPVIDHWWQTEPGWSITANCVGLGTFPVIYGSPGKPQPGYDVRILGPDGAEMGPSESGAITVKMPLPPSCLPTLWSNKEGFQKSYFDAFPGYYETGDAGYIDEYGYVFVMSRTDDIINVAGHRLSTGAMEEVLSHHEDVAECAVIGVADALKGQVPLGIVVLNAGVNRSHAEIASELVHMVRSRIGPVAAFKRIIVVDALPKTRSGKILRATMRKFADGEEYKQPVTIEDPNVLTRISEAFELEAAAR